MLAAALEAAALADPLFGLGEAVPGYSTLLVHYDPLVLNYAEVEARVRACLISDSVSLRQPRRVEIPVVYGGKEGPDLDFVVQHSGLSAEEVVRIHTSREYPVFLMGFTPGFPYLGGMDPAIAAPRLPTPRSRVPAGSVGIAGAQTGVYPLESPGGWRIIGRTPLRLFDPLRAEPFLLAPGDLVRFISIERGDSVEGA
jgi:KipI family sensor histidine kinase inhibitor